MDFISTWDRNNLASLTLLEISQNHLFLLPYHQPDGQPQMSHLGKFPPEGTSHLQQEGPLEPTSSTAGIFTALTAKL